MQTLTGSLGLVQGGCALVVVKCRGRRARAAHRCRARAARVCVGLLFGRDRGVGRWAAAVVLGAVERRAVEARSGSWLQLALPGVLS